MANLHLYHYDKILFNNNHNEKILLEIDLFGMKECSATIFDYCKQAWTFSIHSCAVVMSLAEKLYVLLFVRNYKKEN